MTFEARQVSFFGERLYHIFVRGSDLWFIHRGGLAGPLGILTVPLGYLGLPGALLGGAVNWLAQRREKAGAAEAQDPELLLHQQAGSFKLYAGEIRQAAIEPPRTSLGARSRAGRWVFSVHDGRKLQFDFDSAEQLQAALALITPLLGSTLEINVEWDEASNRFQKQSKVNPS